MGTTVAGTSRELRIVIEPRPVGSRASYIVKTSTAQELEAVRQFFMRLSDLMDVRPLADGPVCAYALQHFEPCRTAFRDIEMLLCRHFEHVTCEHSAGDEILDLVRSLCEDTGSRPIEVDRCGICGAAQVFPTTVVTVSPEDGGPALRRVYCTPCIANAAAETNRDLVRALLASDSSRFGWASGADLADDPSVRTRAGQSAFRLRCAA